MYHKSLKNKDKILSVAPMMDWTDRHCRYFHRLMSAHTLLYTEMVTAPAVIHGDRDRLLGYNDVEHPIALQLGGSDPVQMAQATKIGADYGYDEININIGCPSDRVQSGSFGACLMREPDLVADCVAAMQDAAPATEITVKCRIGVDDQDPHEVLPDFIEKVKVRGVKTFIIHARKAWLKGLSPKENRDVPPLDYDLVYQIKADNPDLNIHINGGITSLDQALEHLERGLDGVMIGRTAYHDPAPILINADSRIYGKTDQTSIEQAVRDMLPYIENHLSNGGRLNQITRHMLGAFAGRAGARLWRRILSESAHKDGAGPELILTALEAIKQKAA
ncbi:MAG: tRNA dihydrouridine(20/20a) synthase DusA [Amylibacter sp.]|nr:tRNA dihydrouridine(20/20a) synthase DusA [Amylibacter sp.]